MEVPTDVIEFTIESLTEYKRGFWKDLFAKNHEFLLTLNQKGSTSEKLEMLINQNEASELALAIEELKTNRPLPSELLKSVIVELGYNLSKVIIDDLKEGIFYSKMILTNGELTKIIDARPVESITQSVRFNCGIYISQKVIEANKKDLSEG